MSNDSPTMLLVKGNKSKKKSTDKMDDPISEVCSEVLALDKESAFAQAHALIESVDFNYFHLGGVLSAIQDNEWYLEEGYESFKECIEERFGIKYRKAMYLIGIYEYLVEADIPWSKVSKIGWTKLKEIAPYLNSENVDEWAKLASELTVIQLQEYIRNMNKNEEGGSDDEGDGDSSPLSTLTIKVHEDQKETILEAIERAKEEYATDYPGVALEAICASYLSGGKKNFTKAGAIEYFKQIGYEKGLTIVEKAYPDMNITVEL